MEQERLAEWFLKQHGIETTGAMLNKYKNRDAIPRMDKCRQFALALDVTIEWLYTGRGPKRPPPAMDENDEEVIRRLHEIDDLGERTDWYGYLKIALKRDTPPPPTGE